MTVLVTGAAGQLGATVSTRFASEHRVVALDRSALDITDSDRVGDAIREAAPTVIVNCAAYNDVDGAEDDAVGALAVNAFGVRALARAAREVDATLVHYSTDFVFDGTGTTPYTEDDHPNPQSVYAMSKLLGEWFAQDARAYVLRLESLFGGAARATPARAHGRRGGSLDRIADAILAGREVPAFSDRTVSPSYVDDVADATAALLVAAPPVGLYHCVGSGMATWVEVATPRRPVSRSARADRPDADGRSTPQSKATKVLCALQRKACRSWYPDAHMARRAESLRDGSSRAGSSRGRVIKLTRRAMSEILGQWPWCHWRANVVH